MQISKGKIQSAQKVVIYGPEGIGKSTFAAQFPGALFIDTEGSTTHMDVCRTQKPSSWTMLIEQVKEIRSTKGLCGTLIIDTADWAEMLCITSICAKSNVKSIEDFGYGRGYTYLEEEFGRLLNLLQEILDNGIHVVMTAHAQMRKFEQPDELGAYDRWELKLEKKTAALIKEWADMVLFANYKTMVVNVDNQGALKGKNKAQGGSRVMFTEHHPCWDAKNRHGLPTEMPFDYSGIAHLFAGAPVTPVPASVPVQPAPPVQAPVTPSPAPTLPVAPVPEPPRTETTPERPVNKDLGIDGNIPAALRDLMVANNVSVKEIQHIVGIKGYYPKDTPISNYDPDFINGVLVGAWAQVYESICINEMPF